MASSTALSPRRSGNLESVPEAEGDPHRIEHGDSVRPSETIWLDGAPTYVVNRVPLGCHEVDGLDHVDRRSRDSPLVRGGE